MFKVALELAEADPENPLWTRAAWPRVLPPSQMPALRLQWDRPAPGGTLEGAIFTDGSCHRHCGLEWAGWGVVALTWTGELVVAVHGSLPHWLQDNGVG